MSWEQLLAIRREAVELARAEKSSPPAACPNDGEPLTQGLNGSLTCKFDGYRWPEDGR